MLMLYDIISGMRGSWCKALINLINVHVYVFCKIDSINNLVLLDAGEEGLLLLPSVRLD